MPSLASRRPLFVAIALIVVMLAIAPANARSLTMRQKLDTLVASYPQSLSGFAQGKLFFRHGGPPIIVDDGLHKTFAEKLRHADVEDMLSQTYPPGSCYTHPRRDFDPGRIRSQALLKRLYGSTKAQVSRRLVRVNWFGTWVRVTRAQGVAKALRAVRTEIAQLPVSERRAAMKTAGTFNWRNIAGTSRLSVHSFGAAIDLDPAYARYWRWARPARNKGLNRTKRIPIQIVEAFERHGFIWGGRWYHYDTMHFEYRPALLFIAHQEGASACSAK